MSKVLITESTLDEIGSAIRLKRNLTTKYKPSEMGNAIRAIGTNLQAKTATTNGEVTADAGYDGLSKVTVNVSGGGGNVIISDQAPTADVGEVGQYYIWETESDNIVYGIRIQTAARDTQYSFNYWGARDIDFVFTDGTSEYHLRDFNNAACAYAIGESGTFIAENGTIDGTTNQYREHNGLPAYYKISADIPTGMALAKVRICGRNDNNWRDFWRTFTIGQWSSDKTFANTLIAEENLVLSDWDTSSQGAYTEFVLNTPVSPTRINISKLYIKTADGWGSCLLWVPEDEEIQLTTKTVTENGTYKASDDGYYGYEQVVVNVAGVGTATGTDGDGDEAVAYSDPETGELKTDKVPSRIEVVTPPTNPYGIYTDGQTITTDGMVVKAYLASGNEYGTVPIEEITIQPTTAVYDASTYNPQSASSDLIDGAIPCSSIPTLIYTGKASEEIDISFISGSGNLTGWGGKKYGFAQYDAVTVLAASSSSDAEFGIRGRITDTMHWSYTHNGKTVYYGAISFNGAYDLIPSQGSRPMGGATHGDMAWTMIYGEIQRAGGHQIITVSWPRPLDGKVLEATFEITVISSNNTENTINVGDEEFTGETGGY